MTQVVRIPIIDPTTALDRKIEEECEARLIAGASLAACFTTPASVVLIFQSDPPVFIENGKTSS